MIVYTIIFSYIPPSSVLFSSTTQPLLHNRVHDSHGIGGVVQPPSPKKSYISFWALKLCFAPVLDLWEYKLITGETNFGACVWRRHGGSIVLAAKSRNPILGVKNKFFWKITTAIEFYAQKLTYMPIFMNFGQLSFFSYTWRHTGKVAGGTSRWSGTAPVTC